MKRDSKSHHNRQWANRAENYVKETLIRRGCHLIGQNVRGRGYELDLVMMKSNSLYIIEVKFRTWNRTPAQAEMESLWHQSKQRALIRGTQDFITRNGLMPEAIRIDLAVVIHQPPGPFRLYYYAGH